MSNDLTNMDFEIIPFVSVGKLTFGMAIDEIADILGMPLHISGNDDGERIEFRSVNYDIIVTYAKNSNTAVEFGFGKTAKGLSFKGQRLFVLPPLDVLNILINEDGLPYEVLGVIDFLGLGITASGFYDNDDSQKAVTVSENGRLNKIFECVKNSAKPFKLP
jgi:hypothetical protein